MIKTSIYSRYSPFNQKKRASYTSGPTRDFFAATKAPEFFLREHGQLAAVEMDKLGRAGLGRLAGHVLPAFREIAVVLDHILIE